MKLLSACVICSQDLHVPVREIIIIQNFQSQQQESRSTLSSSTTGAEFKTIKISEVLSIIYNLRYLAKVNAKVDDLDEGIEIGTCLPCAESLACLYKKYEEVKQRRQVNSYLSNEIEKLDKIIQDIQDNGMQTTTAATGSSGAVGMNHRNTYSVLVGTTTVTKNRVENDRRTEGKFSPKVSSSENESQQNSKLETTREESSSSLSSSEMNKAKGVFSCYDSGSQDHSKLDNFDDSIIELIDEGVETIIIHDDSSEVSEVEDDLDGCLKNAPASTPSETTTQNVNTSLVMGANNCPFCDMSAATAHDLGSHLFIVHTEPTSFKCIICAMVIRARGSLKNHLLYHARMLIRGQDVDNMSEMVQRKKMKETASAASFARKLFAKPKYSKNKRPVQCYICGRLCQSHAGLKIHQKTHNGVKAHTCAMCGFRPAQACNSKNHIRTHLRDQQEEDDDDDLLKRAESIRNGVEHPGAHIKIINLDGPYPIL